MKSTTKSDLKMALLRLTGELALVGLRLLAPKQPDYKPIPPEVIVGILSPTCDCCGNLANFYAGFPARRNQCAECKQWGCTPTTSRCSTVVHQLTRRKLRRARSGNRFWAPRADRREVSEERRRS